MNPLQLVKSIMKNEYRTDSGMQSLKAGQVISGKILRLYPGQTAEVMVGSQKIIAQLEIPLSADEHYWFQVQPGEGKIHLKVLNQLQEGRKANSAESLLSQFGLSNSKDSLTLLNFMIKEKLPIEKAAIQPALQWLKDHPAHEALTAIKAMSEKQLPFTKDIFSAIVMLQNKKPTSELMENLNSMLKTAENTETAAKLQNLITKLSVPAMEKTALKALPLLLESWLSSEADESVSLKVLRAAGFVPETKTEESMLKELSQQLKDTKLNQSEKNAAMIAKEDSLNQSENANQGLNATKKAVWQLLNQSALEMAGEVSDNESAALKLLLSETSSIPGEKSDRLQKLGMIISDLVNEKEEVSQHLLKLDPSVKEKLSSLMNSDIWNDGKKAFLEMKKLFMKMGYSFEADLADNILEVTHEKDNTLKPLLIRYLSENPPHDLKEASEQLLNRITGIQLLNHDHSPLQQTVMQIPIPLLHRTADLTVQWSGKKLDDGKIDPNYCRVLFYLDLEQIGETIVDMQVQNRILTLGIMNERQDMKALAAPFLKPLKENLKLMNYHLSAITFDPPASANKMNKAQLQTVMPKAYNGVDIRI